VSHWSVPERVYWRQWDRLAIRDGVLCRRFESAGERQCIWQVLLPESYRAATINLAHSSTTRGHHCSRSETGEQVMRHAFWCGWQRDVKSTLRNCPSCAQNRHSAKPLQTMEPSVDETSALRSVVENHAVDKSCVNHSDGAVMQPVLASHQLDEHDQSSSSESAASLTDEDTTSRIDGNNSALVRQRNCDDSTMMRDAVCPEYYARYINLFDKLNCWSPPPVK